MGRACRGKGFPVGTVRSIRTIRSLQFKVMHQGIEEVHGFG